MFTKALRPVVKNAVALTKNSGSRVRAYHEPAHYQQTSMSDLPVPQGSWQTAYNAKQTKYNLHLLVGVAFTVVSLVSAKASGLFYFNMNVPAYKKD